MAGICIIESWFNTGNEMVKTCSQKFDLYMQFVTLLKAFACV